MGEVGRIEEGAVSGALASGVGKGLRDIDRAAYVDQPADQEKQNHRGHRKLDERLPPLVKNRLFEYHVRGLGTGISCL